MPDNLKVPTDILNQKIAFLTSKELPQGTPDDLLTEGPLKIRGYNLVPVIWDEISLIELHRFAAVIFRSPWDYQHKKEKFENFVKSLSNLQMPVLNSPELLMWNIDKSYMFELQSKGINIVPSKKILKNENNEYWKNMLEKLPWENLVLKPTISASAYNTYQVNKAEAIRRTSQWEGLSAKSDFLVQEFCPSIQTEGEVSLMFFHDGNKASYSHAILKRPKADDFRVQPYFGGTVEKYAADSTAIEFANSVLSKINSKWLYARVDILKHQNTWALGELEVLEPQLFFPFDPEAASRFAEAIHSQITLK